MDLNVPFLHRVKLVPNCFIYLFIKIETLYFVMLVTYQKKHTNVL